MTEGEIFGGWSCVELMTTVQMGPPPDKLARPSWFIDIWSDNKLAFVSN
jgi:hypothetical protein